MLTLVLGTWLCFSMINVEELLIERRLHEINTTLEGTIMKRWKADWDESGRITSYGYDYYFVHPELGQISNTSFTTQMKGKPGDKVQVYYDVDNPYINKIVGMDYADTGLSVLLWLFIPLVGICFLVYGHGRVKVIKTLLRTGMFGWSNFEKHEQTSVKINEVQQYRLYYNFKTSNDTTFARSFTTTSPSDFDKEEIIIYDQDRPERSVLLYELPYTVAKYIEANWEEVKKL
jgi:hypothetical protein